MYIRAKVVPASRNESIRETKKGFFEIKVKQKKENNLANTRVLELLALHYNISANRIRIVKGAHSPSKLFLIPDA